MNPIGIFGGTFDPIHYGHLRTAFELLQALRLTEVRFMPAGNPPHREQPLATADLRLQMVKAATEGQHGFLVDDREIRREGPSYSVDTLATLRAEHPDRSLCLIVGMDAFLGLPKWYQWREILQLAHVVVAHRPGWRAPGMGPLGELLVDRGTGRIGDLHESRAGCIYIHAVTQLEAYASEWRDASSQMRQETADRLNELESTIEREWDTLKRMQEEPIRQLREQVGLAQQLLCAGQQGIFRQHFEGNAEGERLLCRDFTGRVDQLPGFRYSDQGRQMVGGAQVRHCADAGKGHAESCALRGDNKVGT